MNSGSSKLFQAIFRLPGLRSWRNHGSNSRNARINQRGLRVEFLEDRQVFAAWTVNIDGVSLGSGINSSVEHNVSLNGVNEFAPVLNSIVDLTISSGTADGVVTLIANDPDVGDTLTFGATAQSIEYYLDQSFGFGFSGGNEYLNYFGFNEKWLTTASGNWVYIVPNGNLYRWSGGALANDPLIEQLSPADYNNTALLFYPAINNAPTTLIVVNNVLTINPSDTYIGRLVVAATVNDGLYSVSQSFFVNVLSGKVDNTAPTVINRDPVPVSTVSVSGTNQPPVLAFIGNQTISSGAINGIVTLSAQDPNVGDMLTFDATAQSIEYYLDQTLELGFSGGNEYLNYLGLNEKWLSSAGGTWHYIIPNGKLFRWQGGNPTKDVLVEQLSPSDYCNTALLTNPLANNAPAVLSVVGNVLSINPNDMFVGRLVVTATVSDGRGGSDSKTFFVSVLATGFDAIAPTVTNRIPSPNSTINVSTTNIDVTFSETVSGLDATDLVLTGSGATAIIATPSHLGGNTWRFRVSGLINGTVSVLLAPDTNDIEDTSGNDLAPVSWSFSVSISAVNQPPVLTPIGDKTMPASLNTRVLSLSASDPDVGDIQTFSVSGQSHAYFLYETLGLRLDHSNNYLNWGGIKEKWFIGNVDTWYYITPNGQLYRWLRGSSLSGDPLVATLDASYWDNTSLLYNAEANNAPAALSLDGSLLTIDPNAGFAGVFYVTVVVTDGVGGTDSELFKVTVT